MRTAHGVAAFDLTTGEALWRHPAGDDFENEGIDRLLWNEPAGGLFSADRECFYLIEPTRERADDSAPGQGALLTAREHFGSRQGRLRWQVGGSNGGSEPALAGTTFLGPPLSAHGRLYVQMERGGAIELAVLDAASGRIEWSQELALIEESADSQRRRIGATPSISAE